ncbi:endothelin-1 [Pholidichthys leucotaenia]
MDIYRLISVLSIMFSWGLCTVSPAPTAEAPAAPAAPRQRQRVRTKRCSCATFLDKECVYFCHLDIIWVNTPERVVEYGLGNAPRTRRALPDPLATSGARGLGPRCRCFHGNDNSCRRFCGLKKHLSYETPADTVIRSPEGDGCAEAQCKHKPEADAGRVTRMENGSSKRASPLALRVALKTHLLLKKWRVRQRRRVRAWEGESAAS